MKEKKFLEKVTYSSNDKQHFQEDATKLNKNKKYSPLRDSSFWVVFVLGGGISIINLIVNGMISHPTTIISIVFLVSWETWIILKKGKKWSFLVGFLISIIISMVLSFPIVEWERTKLKKQNFEEYKLRAEKAKLKMLKENPNNTFNKVSH